MTCASNCLFNSSYSFFFVLKNVSLRFKNNCSAVNILLEVHFWFQLVDLIAKLNEKDKEIMDLKYSTQKLSSDKGKGDYFDSQNVSIRSLMR